MNDQHVGDVMIAMHVTRVEADRYSVSIKESFQEPFMSVTILDLNTPVHAQPDYRVFTQCDVALPTGDDCAR